MIERYDLKNFGCFIDKGTLYVVKFANPKEIHSTSGVYQINVVIDGDPGIMLSVVGESYGSAENALVQEMKKFVLEGK
jgi:hypothetical protein